ncbi:transposase [Thermosynechococcus sp. PKX82]|uniref:transposase n=1 Tax=Thermosynechococcus sp. PKX82 TaxID=3074086 RepID=UPI002873243A|nr:transposase [Thermosynechococcus sp. PKX82]WNC30172.1 transposase [Thermosynechococcus sp. PKX82]
MMMRVAPTTARRVAPTEYPPRGPAPCSIGAIIGQFKSITTKRINALRDMPGAPVWQRNYYEHIIRNDESLNRIRQYIAENPLRWYLDRENPHRIANDDLWDQLFKPEDNHD